MIYVEANNAPNIGNYCGSTPKPLTSDFEIPLNGNTYNFRAGNNDNSSVNIGNISNCGLQFPARLYVEQSDTMPAVYGHAAIAGVTNGTHLPLRNTSYGIMGIITEARGSNAGIYGSSAHALNAAIATYGTGVFGTAEQNAYNYGVRGSVDDSNADANYGVYGNASNGAANYAVYGYADTNYANTYAGFFDGHVVVTGNLINSSDRILKRNIDTIANPISIINQLQPKTYFFDTANTYGIRFSGKKQYGFIAQDVEQILPELVSGIHKPEYIDTSGKVIYPAIDYKGVNYNALFGIIVAAMQEQQNRLESKDSVIAALANRILYIEDCMQRANLCNTNNAPAFKKEQNNETNVPQQDIQLKNLQTIILNQNTPNPFAEQTVIGYYLPQEVKTAAIIFYNAEGREINRAEIATRGKGAINVYAQDLSSGVYSYTLIADGNVIDTKRMVKR